jgi:hypothetical protein
MISFVEQTSAGEANGPSASQEIPNVLWYLKVHYGIEKSLQLVGVLSQMNPVGTLQSIFKTYFNNILASPCRSS